MKKELLEKIKTHTKDNPISVKQLAHHVNEFLTDDTTQRTTRLMITKLIEEGNPIGSCGSGYFYINTDKELEYYIQNLKSRIKGIQNRIEDVRNAFFNKTDIIDYITFEDKIYLVLKSNEACAVLKTKKPCSFSSNKGCTCNRDENFLTDCVEDYDSPVVFIKEEELKND